MSDWLAAIILGLVEGLTEFIPVSSTGHLLLLGHFMGFESSGKTFEIVIQLGALLAIISVYFKRLWTLATRWPVDPEARRFLIGLLLAFAPAVAVGFLAYGFIKDVLFETPQVICVALIVGGVILLALDRMDKRPQWLDASQYPMRVYFLIGLFQCLAMIPGVSRAGATIIGAADIYVSDFGNLEIVPNRFQRERDAFVIDPEYAALVQLRPIQQVPLAKTGDAEKRMLVVEYGLKVKTEKAHGVAADLEAS